MESLTKRELRSIYKQKRNALSSDEVIFLSQKIVNNFIEYFKVIPHSKVHCFISIIEKKEIDTTAFFDYFFKNEIRVFVPKIIGEEVSSVEVFPNSKFEINNWGIKEPVDNIIDPVSEFDICITPLLYCDKYGNRLGYGKGFYDRFFDKTIVKNKIGINFFEINENISDFNKNDIPLDFLVTPFSVNEF